MSRDTVRELMDFMGGNATVTGGRVYFPERKLRELLRSAQEALAQQPATPEGMDEAIRRLETTAFNIERIRVMDDNARRFAVEDIRAAVAMLAAAQQEGTT